MNLFFARHQYLIVWILGLTIIGSLAILIVQMNNYIPPSQPTFPSQPGTVPQTSATQNLPVLPPTPPLPSITFVIEKTAQKNNLLVHWENLPANTTALNIFRRPAGTDSTGTLVATLSLLDDNLENGSTSINLGNFNAKGYSFYAEAIGGDSGTSPDATSSPTSTIIWTSDPVIPLPPGTPSSTTGNSSSDNGGSQNQTPTSTATTTQSINATTSPTSTQTGGGNGSDMGSGTSTTPSSTSGSGDGPNPNQNAYYTPQIQGIGGTPDRGTFWVQHMNQIIEIGWQGLPEGVTSIVIARSPSSTGPWNQLLQEQNPSTNGSSSLQLVDGTVGDPYYYQMTALSGTTTVLTYGPDYLPPAGE